MGAPLSAQFQSLELWRHALVASVRGEAPDLSARQMALMLSGYLGEGPHTVRGLAQVLLGDQAITGYPDRLSTWGNGTLGDLAGLPRLIVPIEFAVMALAAVAVGLLLHRTVHGRRIFAIGANRVAARFSGIAVDRYRFGLFVFAGLMAALASVLLTGRIGSTRPNLATGWELDAVTIVVLGGVAIEGGRGSIVGTVLASVLLGS